MNSKNNEGLNILFVGGGKEQEESARKTPVNFLELVSEIKEYSDPVKFENIYCDVLRNKEVNFSTFWGEKEIRNFSKKQHKTIEGYLKEYKEFKGLLLHIYENLSEFASSKRKILDFDSRKASGFIKYNETFEKYLGDYNTFAMNCLAFEIIRKTTKRELSVMTKLLMSLIQNIKKLGIIKQLRFRKKEKLMKQENVLIEL